MKLTIQTRPVVVDQSGSEVDLSKEVYIEKLGTPRRLILDPRDIAPVGELLLEGSNIEVETLGEHITNLTREVLERGDVRAMKNFYWNLGLGLRCVTSEENAKILIEALTKGETL